MNTKEIILITMGFTSGFTCWIFIIIYILLRKNKKISDVEPVIDITNNYDEKPINAHQQINKKLTRKQYKDLIEGKIIFKDSESTFY